MVKSLNRLLRLIGSLIFLAVASPVCASLGDNGDRVDDAYGKVVEHRLRDDGTVSVLYHKDRYLYFVVFDKNQSVLEKYSRVDRRDLSPKEISRFLKANAGRAIWNVLTRRVNNDTSAAMAKPRRSMAGLMTGRR